MSKNKIIRKILVFFVLIIGLGVIAFELITYYPSINPKKYKMEYTLASLSTGSDNDADNVMSFTRREMVLICVHSNYYAIKFSKFCWGPLDHSERYPPFRSLCTKYTLLSFFPKQKASIITKGEVCSVFLQKISFL